MRAVTIRPQHAHITAIDRFPTGRTRVSVPARVGGRHVRRQTAVAGSGGVAGRLGRYEPARTLNERRPSRAVKAPRDPSAYPDKNAVRISYMDR